MRGKGDGGGRCHPSFEGLEEAVSKKRFSAIARSTSKTSCGLRKDGSS